MCFPVNFAKFLRTRFLIDHLRWLLLNVSDSIQTIPLSHMIEKSYHIRSVAE